MLCSTLCNSRAFVKDIMKDAWETGWIENEIAVHLLIYDFPKHSTIKWLHKGVVQAFALDKAWSLHYKSSKLPSIVFIVQSTVNSIHCQVMLPTFFGQCVSVLDSQASSPIFSLPDCLEVNFSLQNVAAPLSFLKLINQPLQPGERVASHQCFSSNSPPSLT